MEIYVLPVSVLMLPIVISLWCVGLTVVSKKGMLLYGFRYKLSKWVSSRRDFMISHLEAKLQSVRAEKIEQGSLAEIVRLQTEIERIKSELTWKDYVGKPLLLCPVCMASLHGLPISLMFVVFNSSLGGVIFARDVFIIVWSIVAAAFFNHVLNSKFINVEQP